MPIQGQPLLIVDHRTNHFIDQLRTELETAGADVVVARDATSALARTARYDFSVCLLGVLATPVDELRLTAKLRRMPILRFGNKSSLGESVPAIVLALKQLLTN